MHCQYTTGRLLKLSNMIMRISLDLKSTKDEARSSLLGRKESMHPRGTFRAADALAELDVLIDDNQLDARKRLDVRRVAWTGRS